FAAWKIARNVRHNEPGLTSPAALFAALLVSAAGFFVASRLSGRAEWITIGAAASVSAALFFFADRRRFVVGPSGQIIADRWEIVLKFAGFRWTRDKANRHFFFTGDTGSGKTSSGMNGLLDSLLRHDRRVGGMVMANKGDEW